MERERREREKQRTNKCTAPSAAANSRGPPRSGASAPAARGRHVRTAADLRRMEGRSMPSSGGEEEGREGGRLRERAERREVERERECVVRSRRARCLSVSLPLSLRARDLSQPLTFQQGRFIVVVGSPAGRGRAAAVGAVGVRGRRGRGRRAGHRCAPVRAARQGHAIRGLHPLRRGGRGRAGTVQRVLRHAWSVLRACATTRGDGRKEKRSGGAARSAPPSQKLFRLDFSSAPSPPRPRPHTMASPSAPLPRAGSAAFDSLRKSLSGASPYMDDDSDDGCVPEFKERARPRGGGGRAGGCRAPPPLPRVPRACPAPDHPTDG